MDISKLEYVKNFGCPICSYEPTYGYDLVNGEIVINSCCGGGCVAVRDVYYCYKCGYRLNKGV